MTELMFIACLASAPDDCLEHRLALLDLAPEACVMGAQPQLAEWVVAHPGYRVTRWTCRTVNRGEKDA